MMCILRGRTCTMHSATRPPIFDRVHSAHTGMRYVLACDDWNNCNTHNELIYSRWQQTHEQEQGMSAATTATSSRITTNINWKRGEYEMDADSIEYFVLFELSFVRTFIFEYWAVGRISLIGTTLWRDLWWRHFYTNRKWDVVVSAISEVFSKNKWICVCEATTL